MVSPQNSFLAVVRAVQNDGDLPQNVSWRTESVDLDTDAGKLPIVEAELVDVTELDEFNTDRVGFTTNDQGQQTGRIYRSRYSVLIRMTIWTAQKSASDLTALSDGVRSALRRYESSGQDKSFVDENGDVIDDIWRFDIINSERADRLTYTPPARRWTYDVRVWGYEEYETDESPIGSISTPDL